MYTLTILESKVKRRIRQLAATTSSSAEAERGNAIGNAAIDDAINAGRKQLMMAVADASLWGKAQAIITTLSNVQEYDIGSGLLKVLLVLYDVTASSLAGVAEAEASHVASATAVTGFTGLTVNAYAGGYVFAASGGVMYMALIDSNTATEVALDSGTSLPALSSEPVILMAPPSVTRSANTVEAAFVETAAEEEAILRDPMDAPSVTNPKYRLTKSKLRLIVSTDGSVTAGKSVLVEALYELSDLSTGASTTGLPETLDELVVDWAVHLVTAVPMPEVSMIAQKSFYERAAVINGRK